MKKLIKTAALIMLMTVIVIIIMDNNEAVVLADNNSKSEDADTELEHVHVIIKKVPATEPVDGKYGNIEYYICACGSIFIDENTNKRAALSSVLIPANNSNVEIVTEESGENISNINKQDINENVKSNIENSKEDIMQNTEISENITVESIESKETTVAISDTEKNMTSVYTAPQTYDDNLKNIITALFNIIISMTAVLFIMGKKISHLFIRTLQK